VADAYLADAYALESLLGVTRVNRQGRLKAGPVFVSDAKDCAWFDGLDELFLRTPDWFLSLGVWPQLT
jgi:hypothetical protein